MLYSNRMEVENPGGLYGRITVDELGKMSADTRNPFIAGGLEVLLGTENRFSGIPTIIHEMKKAGLPPAVFESKRGVFKVTLYNYRSESRDKTILNGTMREIIAYCTELYRAAEQKRNCRARWNRNSVLCRAEIPPSAFGHGLTRNDDAR